MLIRVGSVLIAILLALSGLAALTVGGGLALFTGQKSNAGNTLTTADCFPGHTAFLDPSADAADTGGSGNGFEDSPQNAYSDSNGNASNINGSGDRHRYYSYSVSMKSSCAIEGIEVRLDWWVDATGDASNMQVELSWDGGGSWTSAKTDSEESTVEHAVVLGGSTDTWGHSWTVAQLNNSNFRIRLTCNCSGTTCAQRDFYLDWVPVKVYYGPS
jgi:hypothetical protein